MALSAQSQQPERGAASNPANADSVTGPDELSGKTGGIPG